MKKLTLPLILFFACLVFTSNAQNISFSFTANHTCSYAALDSVFIENLTQGGDTTLYWNDTVLTFTFNYINEINARESGFYVSQNYPNPFETQTQIDIFVPEQDIFTINIFDITGRKVISSENILGQGLHNFTFYAGNSNNYIFVVNSTKYLQQILMVQVSSLSKSAPVLEYNKNISAQDVGTKQKSLKSYFPYDIGDELRFTGFVGGDFAEITDNPNSNEDYIFDIADLVPEQPSPIIGESSICEHDTGLIYSVEHTDYVIFEWAVPDDWEIISGQGTNSITVDAGLSGNISVFCSNNCGNSPERVLQVTANPYPEPEITSSSDDICVGETRLLTATPTGGVFSILSGNATIDGNELTANQSGSIIEADTVIIQYEITINGCTGFSTQDIIVNQNPIATISGETEACDIVTLTASGGLSYMWSGGSSFNSAENSFIESGTYSVTVIDENECTDVAYADVTVKFAPTAPIEALHLPSEQQIIWNWNSSTIGANYNYKYNIFNQYGTAFDNGTSTTYTQEGLHCGTEYSLYVWAYNECGESEVLILNEITLGSQNPCEGITAPLNFGIVESSCRCWLDRNLGASQVATSSTDVAAYGDLYQWGRAADGHQIRSSEKTTILSNTDNPGHGNFITPNSSPYDWRAGQNDNLWQGVTGTNNPCPPGWRVPTMAEWQYELDTWDWSGVDETPITEAFASPLKLPVAGYRLYSNGTHYYVGYYGRYWSSTVNGQHTRSLHFKSNYTSMLYSRRAHGYSVRCLKD